MTASPKKKKSRKKTSKKKRARAGSGKKKSTKKKAGKKKSTKKKAKKKAGKKKSTKKKAKKKTGKKKSTKKKAKKKTGKKKRKSPIKEPGKKKKKPIKEPGKKKKKPIKDPGKKKGPIKDPARNKRARQAANKTLNNLVVVIFDSCRYDSFMEGKTKIMRKLGPVERRWSYASWTAPSHYNLLTGLMPHLSPQNVYASEYYKKDFMRYSDRLGVKDISFRSIIPHIWFPQYLQRNLHYQTHARVSLPVLNPRTTINRGFDGFKLMDKHNDMRAMVQELEFGGRPSFHLLNVGETHYPYALPDEPPGEWPRVSGVHGVFKHLDDHVVGGKLQGKPEKFFDQDKLDRLRQRQIDAVSYLDGVVEELFDTVPKNTWVTLTADHGELFGEMGYFGHGPIQHDKVFEVPFLEGKIR